MDQVSLAHVFISTSPASNPINSCFQMNITRMKFPFASDCWELTDSEAAINSVYSELYNTSYSTLVRNTSLNWE